MNTGIAGLPLIDLDAITNEINLIRHQIKGCEVLIYGGTGFIGTWITSGLVHANRELNLNLTITIVTRDAKFARNRFPEVSSSELSFIECDLSAETPPEGMTADIAIHGATPAVRRTGLSNPDQVLSATIQAAKHAGTLTSQTFSKTNVIHLSSGAIYGPQPMDMKNRNATDSATSNLNNQYTKAKVSAEELLSIYSKNGLIDYQSPRLFAFAGPLLSLGEHFAIGNFVRDGLAGLPIDVFGSPQTIRSYLHPRDLVRFILKLSTPGPYKALNIGSTQSISMYELASLIDEMTSRKGIRLISPSATPSNYVPSMSEWGGAWKEDQNVLLTETIESWLKWL